MKARPLLIIAGSILIGIIVGFLISAQLRHKRMRSVRVMSSERYFRDVLYRVVEPDEDLRSKLEPIIESYGKEGRDLQREFRKSFETHNENYWNDIKALLSVDQLKKLDEFNKKREGERRRFRPDTTREKPNEWEERRGRSGRGRHDGRRPDSTRISNDSARVIDRRN